MFFQGCVLIGSDRTMPKREGCPNPKNIYFETKNSVHFDSKIDEFQYPISNLKLTKFSKSKE